MSIWHSLLTELHRRAHYSLLAELHRRAHYGLLAELHHRAKFINYKINLIQFRIDSIQLNNGVNIAKFINYERNSINFLL